MPKIFEKVSVQKPKMSAFDLSREQKLSCKFGELIPTYLEEVVPGDQFSVKTELMMRLAPMIAPVMHRVNVYMHYFFVPNRIIWDEWEDFITGGRQGISDPVFPTETLENIDTQGDGRLSDYFGLPPNVGATETLLHKINMLPFRAYTEIWNEYYRDPNLVAEIDVHNASTLVLAQIRKRAWEKDYLTSSLPWPQRNNQAEGVTVPAEVQYKDGTPDTEFYRMGSSTLHPADGNASFLDGKMVDTGNFYQWMDNIESIEIDINELRTSNALQRWFEKSARGGYRYIETILSHFGVRTSDHRLQRPEYLGGGKQPIVISEVLNTSDTANAPQGDMAGHGIAVGEQNRFKEQFEEHGWVMGIMSVLPKTAYQQGIHRHWSREDKTDFYWPEFAHLGEQAVLQKEAYVGTGQSTAQGDETFGYQQRYAEYKYGCSTVHGDFRDSLDFWHMGRKFATPPSLNSDFIESDPTDRIFAVQDGSDYLWVQLYHDVKARRPMPYFSTPRL